MGSDIFRIIKKKLSNNSINLIIILVLSGCTVLSEQPIPSTNNINPISLSAETLTAQTTAIEITNEPDIKKPLATHTPLVVSTLPDNSLSPEQVYSTDEVFPGHAFLYHTQEGSQLVFFDGWGKIIKSNALGNDPLAIGIISFQPPCTFVLYAKTDQEFLLLGYDLASNQSDILFKKVQKQTKDLWLTYPTLSTTGRWVAYVVWSGDKYYNSAEFQDLEITQVLMDQPMRITSRGGASFSGGTWSPVKDKIAFSDTDAQGNQQLYIYTTDGGTREVLTDFSDSEMKIGQPVWSENGYQIAFIVKRNYPQENHKSELWVAEIQSKQSNQMTLPDTVDIISPLFYWSESGKEIVVFTNDPSGKFGIFWVDVTKNKIYYSFEENKADKLNNLQYPIPITKDLRAVGSFEDNLIYDASMNTIIYITENQQLTRGMLLDTFVIKNDISQCFTN